MYVGRTFIEAVYSKLWLNTNNPIPELDLTTLVVHQVSEFLHRVAVQDFNASSPAVS